MSFQIIYLCFSPSLTIVFGPPASHLIWSLARLCSRLLNITAVDVVTLTFVAVIQNRLLCRQLAPPPAIGRGISGSGAKVRIP